MKKLSAIALSISIVMFSNNAFANAQPKPQPQPQPTNPTPPPSTKPTPPPASPPPKLPTTAPNDPKPSNLPTKPANDPVYNPPKPTPAPKPSRTGKVIGNIKKILKPDPITIGVLVGGALVDYVMDPNNNRPQPIPISDPANDTACQAFFGNDPNKLMSLSDYVSKINSRNEYDNVKGYKFEVESNSISNLSNLSNYYIKEYSSTKVAIDRLNVVNTDLRVKFTHVESGSTSYTNYGVGIYISCVEPAPQEQPQDEPSPQDEPQPQPQPLPSPNPNPDPATQPQPQPLPSPNPNPDPATQPQPNPNPVPSPVPQPQPQPNPNPVPQPQPNPNPVPSPVPAPQPQPKPNPNPAQNEEYEINLDIEFPPFCEWAKPVCDFIDWVKQEDKDDDTEIDIPDEKPNMIDTNIKFNGQCPKDIVYDVTFGGKTFTLFNFEWHKFCQFLAYLKWVIIAMASLGAFKIVGGVNVSD